MNRFVIIDGLPYLLANGKAHAVRFDAEGFTVGEAVDKAVSPYPLYTALEIKAKCVDLDSIKGSQEPDQGDPGTEPEDDQEDSDQPEPDQGDPEENQEKPLEKMTLAELKEYAEANNVDLGGARTKATIIEAINAAQGQVVS